MRILYLGDSAPHSGSCQRAVAFRRLGHEVRHLDPENEFIRGRWQSKWHYHTGYRFLGRELCGWLAVQLGNERYDLAWIDGGSLFGVEALGVLRLHVPRLVNYNVDDPTGPRDWRRFHTLRRAVSHYDVMVTVREPTRVELLDLGAPQVLKTIRSYDDELLKPVPLQEVEKQHWSSGVLFVGTWMPERGPFLAKLVQANVPLTIYGDRWSRAPEWPLLRAYVRNTAIYGRDYVRAIQSSKICLGLLSRENRDLHTIRSSEIPYIGSLFCAERTSEHMAMYVDGQEAVFWSDEAECISRISSLLSDDAARVRIAAAGHARVLALKLAHVDVLAAILAQVCERHPREK